MSTSNPIVPLSQTEVAASIQSAVSQGEITAATAANIIDDIDDIGLAAATGAPLDELDSEEVTLAVVMLDASYSMHLHRDDVIRGYNEQLLRPLLATRNKESIFLSTWVFSSIGARKDNCRLLHGFQPVSQCPQLDATIYDPDGGTPMWDAVHYGLGGLVSYGQQLRDAGARTKCIAVVLSDGQNNDSQIPASQLRNLSKDLLAKETYVLSYAYFGDESEGDNYAEEIGFPTQHRITASLNDTEIRRIFREVSSSVISTSQAQVSTGLSANTFFGGN